MAVFGTKFHATKTGFGTGVDNCRQVHVLTPEVRDESELHGGLGMYGSPSGDGGKGGEGGGCSEEVAAIEHGGTGKQGVQWENNKSQRGSAFLPIHQLLILHHFFFAAGSFVVDYAFVFFGEFLDFVASGFAVVFGH